MSFPLIFSKRPDPALIREEETLSRFIKSGSHYSKEKREVKYGAFIPTKKGQTSVFRTSGLTEGGIWLLGRDQVGSSLASGHRMHGRGDIRAREIRPTGLRAEPEVSTHPRHANILGWPSEKPQQLVLAGQLALNATLHLLEGRTRPRA